MGWRDRLEKVRTGIEAGVARVEDTRRAGLAAEQTQRQRLADAPVQVRTYRSAREYQQDAPRWAAAGWIPQGQSAGRGRVNTGRSLAKSALFLPWGIIRPSRKADPVTVTWVRREPGEA